MSFRKFSSKVKSNLSKKLYHLAEAVDQAKLVKKNGLSILITGGSGHLADKLVTKIVENVSYDIRGEAVSIVDATNATEKNAQFPGERIRKRIYMQRIEQTIEKILPDHLRIVLVDLIDPSVELLRKDYVTFIKGSFTDADLMNEALIDIDSVFHLAAVGMTGQYATDRKACMDINAVGTSNLLSWSRQKGVKRFVYSSSIGTIFTGNPLVKAGEDQPRPSKYYNYYCESKSHAESIVCNASCDEIKTAVLRFSGIYGPGEKRLTQRVVDFMKSGWWVADCRPNGIEAQIQLSSVDNCVQGLVKSEARLRIAQCKHGQIYNIMDGQPVGAFSFWAPLNSVLGLFEIYLTLPPYVFRALAYCCEVFARVFNKDPYFTRLEVDLLLVDNTFSIDKARCEIGYEPSPSPMPEMIEKYEQDAKNGLFREERLKFFICKMILFSIITVAIITYILNYTLRYGFMSIFYIFAHIF